MQKYKPFLLILFILAIPVDFSAQDFKTVHDGVEYAEVTRNLGDEPVKINLLRLDLKKVRVDVHHALDAAIGTETTSSIAKRKGAVAAINAGFFRLDTSIFAGDSAGILQIDGKLLSESKNNRITLGIVNKEQKTEASLAHLELSSYVEIGDKAFTISGINREIGKDEIIEYTPEFDRTTLKNSEVTEIYVRSGKITNVIQDQRILPIRSNTLVYLVTGKAREDIVRVAKVDSLFRVQHVLAISNAENFNDDEDIIAGVPQLIKNGKIDITWEQEKAGKSFVETRHPRTAVAKMKDGKFLMITVDGRQPGASVGMNLNELAAYLLEIGAMDAMNLDGGGSTTMFLDGKVVNKPSGTTERKVSDAIVVTLRRKR